MHGDSLDAPANHLLDHQPVALQVDRFTRAGHSSELGQHQSSDSAHVITIEAMTQRRLQLGERDTTLDSPLVLTHDLNLGDFVGVVFVLNLAHDLFEDVLQSHDAGGSTELVYHN